MKRMRQLSYWIKERCNPQLGTYYVACGQLTVAEAKRMERTIYGDNTMLRFATKELYDAKLDELRKAGKRVQS